MISINEAITIVKNSKIRLEPITLNTLDALNYFLAKDIYSPINMPPFSQSAMDGYAVCGELNSYTVIGEIKAGDTQLLELKNGEAFRIFTGAMTPNNTTSIAKQEIVDRIENKITLTESLKKGTSIRLVGEELKQNDLVLKKGTKITPAAVGLLSGLGFETISVYKKPTITLIVTGDELTKIGQPLLPGKIYESNSFTIKSALLNYGYQCDLKFVKDNFEDTKNTIDLAIKQSDLVILTGGISVGDYDFVGKALHGLNVKQQFYKVNQKPGKPLYYGELNNTKIFALPGNPAAALTCFYVYVLTALQSMMGNQNPTLSSATVKLTHNHNKKGDRANLLKALVQNNQVQIHKGQSSAMLSSFVEANCLIHLQSGDYTLNSGDEVEILLIP